MTRTISLPFLTAKAAATAVLPHIPNGEVTPVLMHAATIADLNRRASA